MAFDGVLTLAGTITLDNGNTLDTGVACDTLKCLPVLRWASSAGSVTSRGDGAGSFLNPFAWVNNIQANLTGMLTGAGNGLWSSAAYLAGGMDPKAALKAYGPKANWIAATLYRVLFDMRSGIPFIAIPILLCIVIGLWAAYGRQGWSVMIKRFTALCVGLGMFFAMGATSAAHENDSYPMTPYWLISTTQDIVSKAGGGLASSFSQNLEWTGGLIANGNAKPNMLSCRRYTSVLNQAASKAKEADALASGVNLMWEETGLRIWMASTYGQGDNASNVFCRVLEYRAGANADQTAAVTRAGIPSGTFDRSISEHSIAFWPSLMSTKSSVDEDVSDDDPADTSDQMIDRYVMMWQTCQLNEGDKGWTTRKGFGFLDLLPGSDRKNAGYAKDGGWSSGSSPERMAASCAAAFTGNDHETKADYNAVTGNANSWKAVTSGTERENVSNLVKLFDISTNSNWKQILLASDSGSLKDRTAALQTMLQQHGEVGNADILAGLLFMMSGLVALLFWGVGCGLMKIMSIIVAGFLASVGLMIGFLILAFAPDKGRRAVLNAGSQCAAWICGPTLVSMVASTGVLFVNIGMTLLKLIGDNGQTTGSMLTVTLASLILPIAYVKVLQYLCVRVWRIGDPLSLPGLAQMAGFGGAMKTGLKMAAGGIAGGAAAMLAGGGIGAALSAAGRVAGSGGRMGVIQAAMGGWDSGKWDSYRSAQEEHYRKRDGQGGAGNTGDHRESDADRAAGQPDVKPAIGGKDTIPATGGTDAGGQAAETDRTPGTPVISATGEDGETHDGDTTVMPEVGGDDPTVMPETGMGEKPYLNEDGKPIIDQSTGRPFTFTQGELNRSLRKRRRELRHELYAQGKRGMELQRELDGRLDPGHNIGIWDDIRQDAQRHHDASVRGAYRDAARGVAGGFGLPEPKQPIDWKGAAANVRTAVGRKKEAVAEWASNTKAGRAVRWAADTKVGQAVGYGFDRTRTAIGQGARHAATATTQWAAKHPKTASMLAGAAALTIPGAAPLAVAATMGGGRAAAAFANPDSGLRKALAKGRTIGATAVDDLHARVKGAATDMAANLGERDGRKAMVSEQERILSENIPLASSTFAYGPAARPVHPSKRGLPKPIPVREGDHVDASERKPAPPKPAEPKPPVEPTPPPEVSRAIRVAGSRNWNPSGLDPHAGMLPDENLMAGMEETYTMRPPEPDAPEQSMPSPEQRMPDPPAAPDDPVF